jgi:osmoprotectant transport system permease protein
MKRLKQRDNIALFGCVLGFASLFFGWLTLKPNRLAQGTSLSLKDSFTLTLAIVIVIIWVLCLILAFLKAKKANSIILGLAGNLLLAAIVAFAGFNAGRLLQSEPEFYRVSISSGIWLSLGGVAVVIFASSRRLKNFTFWEYFIRWSGLAVIIILIATGFMNDISIMQEFLAQKARFIQELQQHVLLFGLSIVLGSLIGIPLGIWASQSKAAEKPVFYLANIAQTIPSLALFGILIAPLSILSQDYPVLRQIGIRGIGTAPAIIALVIYSLLPIIQNTFAGIRQLDPAIVDAGKGMGMGRFLRFRKVELPLAAPLVLEGVRTAAVQAVGNTAVAALIGAGGLGQFIFQGLGQAASDLIILGSIPIIILALMVDGIMRTVIFSASPKGLVAKQK